MNLSVSRPKAAGEVTSWLQYSRGLRASLSAATMRPHRLTGDSPFGRSSARPEIGGVSKLPFGSLRVMIEGHEGFGGNDLVNAPSGRGSESDRIRRGLDQACRQHE